MGSRMKAIEFESKLTSDARLDVPEAVAEKIPKEATVRVIVLMPEDAEDQAWRHLTESEVECFISFSAYLDALRARRDL